MRNIKIMNTIAHKIELWPAISLFQYIDSRNNFPALASLASV